MNYPPNVFDLQQQIANLQSQLANVGTAPYLNPPNTFSQYANISNVPQPAAPNKLFRQISRVHGLQGAKEYQSKLSAGSSEIIADDDADVLYMVMVDANGNSPEEIAVLDFQIRKQKAEQPQYVTRQDFDAFTSEIRQLLKKEESNEQLA